MTTAEPRYSVVVTARGVAVVAAASMATVLGVMVVRRCGLVFVLLGLAAVEATVVEPAFGWLRRFVPSAVALTTVVVGALATVAAALGVLAWEVDRQAQALSDAIARSIESLEPGSAADEVAQKLHIADRAQELLDGMAGRIVVGGDGALSGVALFGQVILVSVLAAFMIVGTRPLIDSAIGAIRTASGRERAHATIAAVHRDAGGFLRRTLVVSLAHGIVAGLLCWAFGLEGSIGLGYWVAGTSTIPIVGPLLGWAPVIAVGSVDDHPLWLLVSIAVIVTIADRVARHGWVGSALRLGPLLTLAAVSGGYFAAGLRGAAIGVLVVAGIAAAVRAQPADALGRVTEAIEGRPDGDDDGLSEVRVQAASDGESPRLRLQPSVRTAVVFVVLVIGAAAMLHLAHVMGSLLIWASIAAFICFGLDRPASAVERVLHLPRWGAVTAVLGTTAAVIGLVIGLAGPSIVDSATSIVDDAPRTISSLEGLPVVGPALEDRDASRQIEDFIASIPDRVESSNLVDRVVSTAGDGLVGAVLIVSLLLAALLDVPRLARATSRRVPVVWRRQVNGVSRAVSSAVSRAAAASAFVAALNGTVVMLIALALHIPIAVVLGVWSAGWNFIPQIGGFVGAFPLVALGFGQSPTRGLIALVVFVTYQTFENHVLQPLVGARAIRVPPLIGLSVALVGGALAGFVGALLAGPVLAMAKGAWVELRGEPPPRVEDRFGRRRMREPRAISRWTRRTT
jgi:predicted PurR-regulated permease PerM